MGDINDSDEAEDGYGSDSVDNNEPLDRKPRAKLVNGINIKDLFNGKDVVFEISDSYEDSVKPPKDYFTENKQYINPKNMRENRGAPPIDCTFESLAKNMIDVGDDGLVKKQLISHGTGAEVPEFAYVTVHYNMYKEHCEIPFDSTYLRKSSEKIRLDVGETLVGLERAIKSMKKGENSRFLIKWEVAFGAMGCPDRIEPKCDILIDIILINFVEIDRELFINNPKEEDVRLMEFRKSISTVKKDLHNGSDEFGKGNTKAAISCYRRALKVLDNLNLANQEEEEVMLRLKVKGLVNLAVCHNKLGKHEQACIACQNVLSIEPNNVKGLFHYGKASVALSNFSVALQMLKKANKLKPNDKDINRELKRLDEKKSLYEISDKMFWQKAFQEPMEPKENEKNVVSSELENMEKSLREHLQECLDEKKPFFLPGVYSEDQKNICRKVAKCMGFRFNFEDNVAFFQK